MEKRRISILGDSISTFAGYTPEEAVFYDSYVQWETFFNIDSTISKRVYSDIIRENAQKAQVYIADLANVQEEYETVDGVHPNKAGMHTLAQMWVREMKKFICK